MTTRLRFKDGALYDTKHSVLVIADLHLGYEADNRKKGVHLPPTEFQNVFTRIKALTAHFTPKHIVLNGDIKHGIGALHEEEWRHIRRVITYLSEHATVHCVGGNHDPFLDAILKKHGLYQQDSVVLHDLFFIHGDRKLTSSQELALQECAYMIIGHLHPAVRLGTGPERTVKCYLTGQYKNTPLIVLPSMLGLIAGTDVLSGSSNSPLITNTDEMQVVALTDSGVVPLGIVKRLRSIVERS